MTAMAAMISPPATAAEDAKIGTLSLVSGEIETAM